MRKKESAKVSIVLASTHRCETVCVCVCVCRWARCSCETNAGFCHTSKSVFFQLK